jgi:hypothetical protein
MAFAARKPGQTRGAIGLSLIFCFFCIKTKERANRFLELSETISALLKNNNYGHNFFEHIPILRKSFCIKTKEKQKQFSREKVISQPLFIKPL